MKKLFVLLALIAFMAVNVPAQNTPIEKVKTELKAGENVPIDTLKADVYDALKDSAVQAELIQLAKDSIANKPAEGSGFWTWFRFIAIIIITAIGFIVANIRTKRAYWFLMPIQVACKTIIWLLKNILTPKNKNIDGGNHSL